MLNLNIYKKNYQSEPHIHCIHIACMYTYIIMYIYTVKILSYSTYKTMD